MKLWIPPMEAQKPKQPMKCQHCIWGRWDALKQFRSKINCIKEQ